MSLSPTTQALFERSNVYRPSYDHFAGLLKAILDEQLVSDEQVVDVSMVEFFRKPDGSSMGSMTMLLAILPDSVSLAREKRSLFSKSVETQVYFLRDVGSIVADEREWSNGQGEFAIQALSPDSRPVFRLGWDWAHGGAEPRTMDSARSERDRVLAALRGYVER